MSCDSNVKLLKHHTRLQKLFFKAKSWIVVIMQMNKNMVKNKMILLSTICSGHEISDVY